MDYILHLQDGTELYHHGIKGQKWGVRRYQNPDGTLTPAGVKRYGVSNNRTLKAGTQIQNISRHSLNKNSKKSGRIYASYTDYDNAEYIDMMAGFQYSGKGYKNTFLVKKDLSIASEKEVVNTIKEMYESDPKAIISTFAKAYKIVNQPIFFNKSEKYFKKKLSDIENDPESEKALKAGRDFIAYIPVTSAASSVANDFYSRMIQKGFDAILDTNDAYGLAKSQDPLIIFNMDKLGQQESLKLTKEDLDACWNYTSSKEHKALKKDGSKIAHSF